MAALGSWSAPRILLKSIVEGRNVTLLKIDIDYNEGLLLSDVVTSIRTRQTHVRSMLVELGDSKSAFAACARPENANRSQCLKGEPIDAPRVSHRHGHVHDIYSLQHELGYDVYRVNVHANREIFDWRGDNLNEQMSPPQPEFEPLRGVRTMRKLERLRRSVPWANYTHLLHKAQSLLITREPLLARVRHHHFDLEYGALPTEALNRGFEDA